MTTHAITICSVSFHSRPWLLPNRDLAARLNPEAEITWVVAENSPADSSLRLTSEESRFVVVPGVPFEPQPHAAQPYHHGRAMNETLPHIATRYALFCDPDFFIVRPHWVNDVIAHMAAEGLAFLGVPWHPKYANKFRDFPCVHCMFVDLRRAPLASLDFRPDYEDVPARRRNKGNGRGGLGTLGRWLRQIDAFRIHERRKIGTSRDTSYRIHARYAQSSGVKAECVQPVFRPALGTLSMAFERVLPEHYCFVPKRPGYFTSRGFGERNCPDLGALGCEESVWRDQPFGFHVRSYPKTKRTGGLENDYYRRVTESLNVFGQRASGV